VGKSSKLPPEINQSPTFAPDSPKVGKSSKSPPETG